MSRRKKAIALVLCGAMMLSILPVSVVHAAEDEAEKVYFDGDLFKEKDGFIQFDDTEGMFDWETGGGDYLTYLNENRNNVYVYSGYTYNKTVFTVVRDKLAEFQALYNEYNAQLQMDHYDHDDLAESNTATVLSASIYDIYNDMGEETLDPTEMENKMALIDEMATEMYRAGYIIDAEYSAARRSYDIIDFNGIYISYPEGVTDYASEEELTEITAPWNGVVKNYDASDGSCNITCGILESIDAEAAVKEACPDAEVNAYYSSDDMIRYEYSERISLLFENKFSDDTDDRTGLVNIDEESITSELGGNSEYDFITCFSSGEAPWMWSVKDTGIYVVSYYDKAPDISVIEGAEIVDPADYMKASESGLSGIRALSKLKGNPYILVKGATAEELASLKYTVAVYYLKAISEKHGSPSEYDAGRVTAIADSEVSPDEFLQIPGVISAEKGTVYDNGQCTFIIKFESAVTDGDTAAITAENYENSKALLGYDFVDTAYPSTTYDLADTPDAYGFRVATLSTLPPEDVDGDGDVTLTDAIEALRIYAEYAAGVETAMSDISMADANMDGVATLDDAVIILTAYARKGAGLPQ